MKRRKNKKAIKHITEAHPEIVDDFRAFLLKLESLIEKDKEKYKERG